MFVTSQGHPRTRFARAIATRNVFLAEVARDATDAARGRYGPGLSLRGCRRPEVPGRRQEMDGTVARRGAASLEDIAATACSFVER